MTDQYRSYGTGTIQFDGGALATAWRTISWNETQTGPDNNVRLLVRSAESIAALAGKIQVQIDVTQPATPGVPTPVALDAGAYAVPRGRYLEITAELTTFDPTVATGTPVLQNVTVTYEQPTFAVGFSPDDLTSMWGYISSLNIDDEPIGPAANYKVSDLVCRTAFEGLQIVLNWKNPTGIPVAEITVVRSTKGPAQKATDGDVVKRITNGDTFFVDDTSNLLNIGAWIKEGVWYYYTLFVKTSVATADSKLTNGVSCGTLALTTGAWSRRLYQSLPIVYRTKDQETDAKLRRLTAAGAATKAVSRALIGEKFNIDNPKIFDRQLDRLLKIFGPELDRVEGFTTFLRKMYSLSETNGAWLPYIGQLVGIFNTPFNLYQQQRQEIRSAIYIFKTKGTVYGIKNIARIILGREVQIIEFGTSGIGGTRNYLVNPGFDDVAISGGSLDNFDNWTEDNNVGNATLVYDSNTSPVDGDGSALLITGVGGQLAKLEQGPIRVTGGCQYTLSFFASTPDTARLRWRLKDVGKYGKETLPIADVQYWDDTNKVWTNTDTINATPVLSGSFKKFEFPLTARPTANKWTLTLLSDDLAAATNVDAVKLNAGISRSPTKTGNLFRYNTLSSTYLAFNEDSFAALKTPADQADYFLEFGETFNPVLLNIRSFGIYVDVPNIKDVTDGDILRLIAALPEFVPATCEWTLFVNGVPRATSRGGIIPLTISDESCDQPV